ncbi:RNA polymerase III-inhibiting protein maf1 [Ranunculus cassubicifolius]
MSDTEENKSKNSIPSSTMATTEPSSATEVTKKLEKKNISLSIWPPTQRTRDAVINRLIETLSSPSILSNRYGSLSIDEASTTAKFIEDEAFLIANNGAAGGSNSSEISNVEDDGIEILQIYSKEISKRMLEVVKSKAVVSEDNNPRDVKEKEEEDKYPTPIRPISESRISDISDSDLSFLKSDGSDRISDLDKSGRIGSNTQP